MRVGLIYLQLALFFRYLTFLKLSNTSKIFFVSFQKPFVENNGFEPLTLCVQGRCSSQLS